MGREPLKGTNPRSVTGAKQTRAVTGGGKAPRGCENLRAPRGGVGNPATGAWPRAAHAPRWPPETSCAEGEEKLGRVPHGPAQVGSWRPKPRRGRGRFRDRYVPAPHACAAARRLLGSLDRVGCALRSARSASTRKPSRVEPERKTGAPTVPEATAATPGCDRERVGRQRGPGPGHTLEPSRSSRARPRKAEASLPG